MSLFNTVTAVEEELCPNCQSTITRSVQFKYGDVRQHAYHVGDHLTWGGNDVGRKGAGRVRVSGHPVPCPICHFVPDSLYEVTIRRDRIMGTRLVGREDQELALFGTTGRREDLP